MGYELSPRSKRFYISYQFSKAVKDKQNFFVFMQIFIIHKFTFAEQNRLDMRRISTFGILFAVAYLPDIVFINSVFCPFERGEYRIRRRFIMRGVAVSEDT